MQYKFFKVGTMDPEPGETGLNLFLRQHRVVHVQREFVVAGENSFWGIAVEYIDGEPESGGNAKSGVGKKRVDYKEVLSPEAFALFVRLRDWRKQAAAGEAVPVYTIFTNEQLASIAREKPNSKSGLEKIPGVGEARIVKYSADVLRIVAALENPMTATGSQ